MQRAKVLLGEASGVDLEARQTRVASTTAQREERSKAAQEERAAREEAKYKAVRAYLLLPADKRHSACSSRRRGALQEQPRPGDQGSQG